ncbi:hypothetical protein ACFVTF_28245 [Kitasatospora sp. NPDC057940]|uniref:hypothetical protein n=1 Tax=Kitasatospora sp. NPDC057940 TaxID=3346285 RepID=UPI0036DB8DC0
MNGSGTWYAAERNDLTLAVAAAYATGLHSRAWRIVLTMWPLIVWRVRDDWVPLLHTAPASERADANQYGESCVLNVLGWVLIEEGRTLEAMAHLGAASALVSRAGDAIAEANALIVLAMAQASLGGLDEAANGCERAVELARQGGDRAVERLALQHLARHRADAGKWDQALAIASQALAFDNRPGTADGPRVMLLRVRGEALLGLGNEAEGSTQLDLAAREAESSGCEDGAVRGARRPVVGNSWRGSPGAVRRGTCAAHDAAVLLPPKLVLLIEHQISRPGVTFVLHWPDSPGPMLSGRPPSRPRSGSLLHASPEAKAVSETVGCDDGGNRRKVWRCVPGPQAECPSYPAIGLVGASTNSSAAGSGAGWSPLTRI